MSLPQDRAYDQFAVVNILLGQLSARAISGVFCDYDVPLDLVFEQFSSTS